MSRRIRGHEDLKREDAFFDVPSIETRTSVSRVDLPMLFNNVQVRQLHYLIEPSQVDPLLEGTGLVACRLFRGKCLVSLVFYNYRDIAIGPYAEVVIGIFVRPEMFPDPKGYAANFLKKRGETWNGIGLYVLEMPVTSPEARAAGRELWGFPKFETRIPFALSGRDFEFGVEDPDTRESIVEVRGTRSAGIPVRGFDLVTFSNFRDKIWKTIVETDVRYTHCFRRDLELKIGSSDHGMARNLRALGLDLAKPFLIQTADDFRSRLNHGKAVADWPSPPLPYPPKGGDGTADGIVL